MITVLVAGSLFGAGVAGAVRAVWKVYSSTPPNNLAAASVETPGGNPHGRAGLAEHALALFGAAGLDPRCRISADLAITGRSPESHCVRSLAAGLWFATLMTTAVVAFGAVGLNVAPAAFVAVAVLGFAGGIAVTEAVLRAEATARREELRQDLSTFCELMGLLLAAGAGVENSLAGAAAAGDDWTWRQIRSALRTAQQAGHAAADALVTLGVRLDVPELEELGTAVTLAATSGGRLRASLASRSESLRIRELSRQQAEAARATERMTFPVVAVAVGYLLVLAYPALTKVLTGFH